MITDAHNSNVYCPNCIALNPHNNTRKEAMLCEPPSIRNEIKARVVLIKEIKELI